MGGIEYRERLYAVLSDSEVSVESLGGRLTVPEHDDGTCIEVTLRRPDDAKGR